MFRSPLLLLSLQALVASVLGDSIVIEGWDAASLEPYLRDDGNYTAVSYLGETVTFTAGAVQFDDEDAWLSCNYTASETVDGDVYETWPEGVTFKQLGKQGYRGTKFFGPTDEATCLDDMRIKILMKNKVWKNKAGNKKAPKVCSGTEIAEPAVNGGCGAKCKKTRECFGWQLEAVKVRGQPGKPTRTCNYFSEVTGVEDAEAPEGNIAKFISKCKWAPEENTLPQEDEEE
ncbi:predicted protein [Chaetoceros tenuissimus]|uniref:Uncharacterized protein n=1 Tax=Chaetoceros tenuissimus TaxID=426638 RepID=A0AAD3CLA3_9STRA|nr:predicted protein [Chaetoceros tenuissimus]